MRTRAAPASAQRIACCTVASTSVVSVVVIVWRAIGCSEPIGTLPAHTSPDTVLLLATDHMTIDPAEEEEHTQRIRIVGDARGRSNVERKQQVALKLMRHKATYLRALEVARRVEKCDDDASASATGGGIGRGNGGSSILRVLRGHDGDVDELFARECARQGFPDFK